MRFTSCIPALDMLTVQFDPLSKPVGPVVFKDLSLRACPPLEDDTPKADLSKSGGPLLLRLRRIQRTGLFAVSFAL